MENSSLSQINIKVKENAFMFRCKVVCDKPYFVELNQAPAVEFPAEETALELLLSEGLRQICITSKGRISKFECIDSIQEMEISGCLSLEVLEIPFHTLKTLDTSNNIALRKLGCSYGKIEYLDLSNNKRLTKLHCSNNRITNLNISDLTALTELDCSVNAILELDISKNSKLQTLNTSFNQLESLDCSNNIELSKLNISENNILALDIRNNPRLHQRRCSLGQSFGGIPLLLFGYEFTSLALAYQLETEEAEKREEVDDFVDVTLENTEPKEEQKLATYPQAQLERFVDDCLGSGDDDFEDYQELVSFTLKPPYFIGATLYLELKTGGDFAIDFGDGALVEYSARTYFEELYELITQDGEYISDEELQEYPQIISIEQKSKGRVIKIYGKQYITHLDFSTIMLEALDVTQDKGLEELIIYNREVKKIDLRNNEALRYLDCTRTCIEELDLSNCNRLETLLCSDTDIFSLDLSQNIHLKRLEASSTYLTSIDLSNNIELEQLNLSDCKHLKKIRLNKAIKLAYQNINELEQLFGLTKEVNNSTEDLIVFRTLNQLTT